MTKPTKLITAPFSLRLTSDERARLERDAAGLSMAAYARARLFGDDTPKRQTRGKFPVKDHRRIAHILALLGASGLATSYAALADDVRTGRIVLTAENIARLDEACIAIAAMRADLLRALGLGSGGEP